MGVQEALRLMIELKLWAGIIYNHSVRRFLLVVDACPAHISSLRVEAQIFFLKYFPFGETIFWFWNYYSNRTLQKLMDDLEIFLIRFLLLEKMFFKKYNSNEANSGCCFPVLFFFFGLFSAIVNLLKRVYSTHLG